MTAMPLTDRRSDYVSAVAVELADLAPDDRAELIEELDDHIAALLEDRPDVDLAAELGTPRAYAAELRAAAGLVRGPATRTTFADRISDLGRHVTAMLPWLPPTARFLRPAWWVFRGLALGGVAGFVLGFAYPSGGMYVLFLVGVLASLWVAQRAPATRPWRLGVRIANGVLVVAGLWAAAAVVSQQSVVYNTEYVPNCPTELDNLYAYDASGKPLQDVRLFDQYGNPFDISTLGCGNGDYAPNGIVNAYPWPTASYGDPEPSGPPTSLAPLPGATVSPSGSSSPSPTPSPSGTR